MSEFPLFNFLVPIVRVLMAILFPIQLTGSENMPSDGAVILCANHESLLDPVALVCKIKRPIRFMAKKELFETKWFGKLLTNIGMFPVDRNNSDLTAVRTALTILKQGTAFGIFPQGTRTYKGGHDFHTGIALIALRSGAPVIPVSIFRRISLFKKTRIELGAPVDLTAFSGKYDAASLRDATEVIKSAIFTPMNV